MINGTPAGFNFNTMFSAGSGFKSNTPTITTTLVTGQIYERLSLRLKYTLMLEWFSYGRVAQVLTYLSTAQL
jgi:hypothetical protein